MRGTGEKKVVICIEVNQLVDHVSLRSFFFFKFTHSFVRSFMFAYVSSLYLFHTWSLDCIFIKSRMIYCYDVVELVAVIPKQCTEKKEKEKRGEPIAI